jgi:signal peptidase I
MELTHLLVIALISFLIVMLPAFGFAKCFAKAGIPSWKAWVPFGNTWEMVKAGNIPKYWFFLQFVPILGWFCSMSIFIDFSKLFGKFSFWHHTQASLLPFYFFPKIGMDEKGSRFIGTQGVKIHKRTALREWLDAAVFAIVAATIIRTFFFEAYVIPTPSMERTLLVNDFLFVSKLKYGPRLPMTPLALPFMHNTIVGTRVKSYFDWPSVPYTRWFAKPVQREDIIVFNYPVGDTVINHPSFDSQINYYDAPEAVEADYARSNQRVNGRKFLEERSDEYPVITRPVDKRENFIKRCVAIAGDKLEIRNGILLVNDKEAPLHDEVQFKSYIKGSSMPSKEEFGFREDVNSINGNFVTLVSNSQKKKLESKGYTVERILDAVDSTQPWKRFPYGKLVYWTKDNYGPIVIPAKGMQVSLNADNFHVYQRAIRTYEGNELNQINGEIYINGVKTNNYTFKMNYYWAMGDNRDNSQDSRFWGFVPEDHIVGSPALIWMSWEGGPRWKRLFSNPK